MEFSEKELRLIAAARKQAADARVKRVLILIAMLVGMGLMIAGVVATDRFAYACLAAVIWSIALPQLGGGPKYEDLVTLLESKSMKGRPQP